MSDFKPHEAPARDSRSLPVMLPPRLVGRDAVLAQVYAQLKEGNPVHLFGAAGTGKTALAGTLANAYAQQPGGVLWFNVDTPRLDSLVVRVGRAYNDMDIANADTPIGMIGAVENTLRTHKPLIVLDGEIDADVASRFISRCASGLPTLIVNREKLDGPWAALELPAFDAEQAAILFKQEARLATNEADADVLALVQMLGNSPFAVVIAARAMLVAKQNPGGYKTVLQQVLGATGGDGRVAALTASSRALSNAYQGLLLILGATFTGSASPEMLSLMGGAQVDAIKQAMNVMTQLNLVQRIERYGQPHYRMHPITHTFTKTWLRSSNRLDPLQEKARDSVMRYAQQFGQDDPAAWDRLAAEMDTFLAAADWAAEHGKSDVANAIIVALTEAGDFIRGRGYRHEVMRLREMATGTGQAMAFPAYDEEVAPAANEDLIAEIEDEEDDFAAIADVSDDDAFDDLEDEEDEPVEPLANRLFTGMGDEAEDERDLEELDLAPEDRMSTSPVPAVTPAIDLETASIAELRTALAQAKQDGDQQRQIAVLKALGGRQVHGDMENEAAGTYDELLTLYDDMDDEAGALETLDMLSALAVKTNSAQAAVMHATRGIKLAEALGEQTTRMHLLRTLGDARTQLGESEQASANYSGALEIARTIDDAQNEAIILYKLGYAQLDGSEPESAIDTLEQALQLFKAQEKRGYEGRVLGALGSAYGDMERWAEAINFHTSALYIAREVGDREEEALQLGSLGYGAIQAGQLGQAVLRYRQALHLAFESGDRDSVISAAVDLARLLLRSKKHIAIAELLVDAAAQYDANDRDVVKLKERIGNEKLMAQAESVEMLPVKGTAQDYAANAYALLDE